MLCHHGHPTNPHPPLKNGLYTTTPPLYVFIPKSPNFFPMPFELNFHRGISKKVAELLQNFPSKQKVEGFFVVKKCNCNYVFMCVEKKMEALSF